MFLYHIRRKGMTLEEGYIGVTVNTSKRFSQHIRDARNHKRKSRNYHLYNALRLYDDIEFVIIEEGDDEYILEELRKSTNYIIQSENAMVIYEALIRLERIWSSTDSPKMLTSL